MQKPVVRLELLKGREPNALATGYIFCASGMTKSEFGEFLVTRTIPYEFYRELVKYHVYANLLKCPEDKEGGNRVDERPHAFGSHPRCY